MVTVRVLSRLLHPLEDMERSSTSEIKEQDERQLLEVPAKLPSSPWEFLQYATTTEGFGPKKMLAPRALETFSFRYQLTQMAHNCHCSESFYALSQNCLVVCASTLKAGAPHSKPQHLQTWLEIERIWKDYSLYLLTT